MNNLLLEVILLLDDSSRSKLKVTVSDLIVYNVRIISSLSELNSLVLSKTKTVVVLEDFVKSSNGYSDLVLYKEVFDLNYIYIGVDKSLSVMMGDIAACYSMDPTLISYEVLYSIIYKDYELQERLTVDADELSSMEKVAKQVVSNMTYDISVRTLAEGYLSLYNYIRDQRKEWEREKLLLETSNAKIKKYFDYSKSLEKAYFELIDKSKKLNRTLNQYETILSKDIYDKIVISKYSNRPSIIYLKEYEELIHLNSFITTLFNVFRYQYKRSVKVLRLYDSSASKRVLTIPNYYKVIENSFTRRDVVSNDFVLRVGNYKEVMDLLLTNQSRLDILIIVDCKSHSDTILSGYYLNLSMCRNKKNIPAYGLDPVSTIVNNDPGNVMSWDHYSEYARMTEDERLLFLTSRPVMQTIYELNKVFSQVGV